MAKKRKQSWEIGDYFLIPLADGSYSIGQVVGKEAEALNSAICAFFSLRFDSTSVKFNETLTDNDLISVLFVTRDLLDSGDWSVISTGNPIPIDTYLDLAAIRRSGFVGVKVIGSGVAMKFMDAYHCLYPWNGFYESDYLDKFLISKDKKPVRVLLK